MYQEDLRLDEESTRIEVSDYRVIQPFQWPHVRDRSVYDGNVCVWDLVFDVTGSVASLNVAITNSLDLKPVATSLDALSVERRLPISGYDELANTC